MGLEHLPGFQSLLRDWVVKVAAGSPPRRLSEVEIEQLARASVETLARRALDDGQEGAWLPLADLTRGWIVQRVPGTAPTPVSEEDFRGFVRHALEGLALRDRGTALTSSVQTLDESRFVSASVSEIDGGSEPVEGQEENLAKDPFYYAREHLALSL